MAAPSSPDPPVLMDELVEECLLRVLPEDPADLARAALVSRQWHRVVTGAGFRRRYIAFHRSPPLLGYIVKLYDSIRFVPMSSSYRPRHAHRHDVEAVHSSHGRILLCSTRDWELDDLYLFVWDPIRDRQWELPVLLSTPGPYISYWDAAVVCAVGDGCSHLDCHFKVVVVGISGARTFSCLYSSEADSWSDRIFVSAGGGFSFSKMGSVLVGNTLYFRRGTSHAAGEIIIKYDLLTHQVCTISLQCGVELHMDGLLIATEDGKLGVAMTTNSTLCLWRREQGRFAESRVIQLHGLLPPEDLEDKPWVAGFADTGAGVIFLRTRVGYFTMDLNSGRSKKVGGLLGYFTMDLNSGRSKKVGGLLGVHHIVPYVCFCTPASGTVSTDEELGASVAIDDEPGAGVAVSKDEGPEDVVVSTDEQPGPSMSSA